MVKQIRIAKRYNRLDESNRFPWIIHQTVYRWLRGQLLFLLVFLQQLSYGVANPFRREMRYANVCPEKLCSTCSPFWRRWRRKHLIRKSIIYDLLTKIYLKGLWKRLDTDLFPFWYLSTILKAAKLCPNNGFTVARKICAIAAKNCCINFFFTRLSYKS